MIVSSQGEQIEGNVFKLEGRYYKGRIEEARHLTSNKFN